MMHLDAQYPSYDRQDKDRDERLLASEEGVPKLWNVVHNAVSIKACALITEAAIMALQAMLQESTTKSQSRNSAYLLD